MRNPVRAFGLFALLGIAALSSSARADAQDPEAKRQREQAQEEQAKPPQRAQKAPDKAQTRTPAPAGAPTVEQQRDIAKKAAYYARRSRDQQARIDRLIQIYTQKGDREKVSKLEGMRAQLAKRTDNAMEGFRKRLGDEKWGQLNSEMKRHHGRDQHQKPKETRPPQNPPPKRGS